MRSNRQDSTKIISLLSVFFLSVIVISGCSKQPTTTNITSTGEVVATTGQDQQPVSGTEVSTGIVEEVLPWTVLSGNVTKDEVQNTTSAIQSIALNDKKNTFINKTGNINLTAEGLSINTIFSTGFADDRLEITYGSGKTYTYKLPYSKDNKKKLDTTECKGDTKFDTILCYMPRLNNIFGPFKDVLGKGDYIIYTLSSLEGNFYEQYIFDISKKSVKKSDHQIIYSNDSKQTLVATNFDTKKSVYDSLWLHQNTKVKKVATGDINGFFYDGNNIFTYSRDQTTEKSDIKIISVESGNLLYDLTGMDVGQDSQYWLDGQTLYINYGKILKSEEKVEYYILSYDITTRTTKWLVKMK